MRIAAVRRRADVRPPELVRPALAESRFGALSRWAERLQQTPLPEA